jgi:hypothetical protein
LGWTTSRSRLVAGTLPGEQFEIGRGLRDRVAEACVSEGIHVPTGLVAAPPSGSG